MIIKTKSIHLKYKYLDIVKKYQLCVSIEHKSHTKQFFGWFQTDLIFWKQDLNLSEKFKKIKPNGLRMHDKASLTP